MPVPPAHERHRLFAVLGVTFGLAVTIGNTIGGGILRTPGIIATQLPALWAFLAVWLIGGIYALLGANALAELGTTVPRSGGQYVFVRHSLGDYAGFIVGWSDWISTCGTTAAVSIVVGEYAIVLFPKLRAIEVIALVVVAVLTLIQWAGTKWGSAAQNVTSALKAIVLLLLIGACFWLGGRNPMETTFEPEREGSLLLAFIISLQAVIYTYDGWSAVIYFSEEVKEAGRNIPKAMFGGIASVIAIYLLINVGFLRVVPLGTIAGEKLAAGVVAQHMFGPSGDQVIRIVMIVALISAVSSNVLMAPRVLFAMANDGLFWRGAREVNKGGTPDIALLISSILAALFIVTGTFENVIAKLAFFFVANYTLSFASLFVLRHREPDAQRPFRAWGHPFTTGLALLASVAFLIGAVIGDRENSLWAVGILCVSFPVYLLVRPRKS
ncbi:MAG TPA: APC family permease [Thermoanaerobaculia bacterium]|nr:APC family permease [Thermoanaerobaculia bacterium]